MKHGLVDLTHEYHRTDAPLKSIHTNASVNEGAAGQSELTAIDSITFAAMLCGGKISLSLGKLIISNSLQTSVGATQDVDDRCTRCKPYVERWHWC